MSQNDQALLKCRKLYKQAQGDVQNLHRISQDRMKKRFYYIDKQIKIKQKNQQKINLEEMKFYRNKFHILTLLVNQSIKQNYTKKKFENQVKNILKDNYINNNQIVEKKVNLIQNKSIIEQPKVLASNKKAVRFQDEENIKNNNQRSKSPLQKFFQQNQNTRKVNFLSVIPKSQIQNSKILEDLKKMPKKTQSFIKAPYQPSKEDSRIRDLKRQNEELNKILNKKTINSDNTEEELKKQIYYFKKVNQELKKNASRDLLNLPQRSYNQDNFPANPYWIPYRKNHFGEIQQRNYQNNTSVMKQQLLINSLDNLKIRNRSRSIPNRNMSKSPRSKIFRTQSINDSQITSNSSKIQRQRQIYINNTPQILFQNQLIKVIIIRNPIKIQQRLSKSINYQNQNPQDINPNEQKLQLIVLNNAKSQIVRASQIFVKTQFVYDKKLHKIGMYKKPTKEYSKKIANCENIVYSEIIRVRLLDKEGYNEEIKVVMKANFFYNSQINKKKNRMAEIIDKKQNSLQIQVKLPVTFIQFSNKPFDATLPQQQKSKLTIVPNPLYDSFQHTYMNTRLPIKRSIQTSKFSKQSSILYGRSFIHNFNNNNGQYLQSEIQLSWLQKKSVKYLSIQTIQEWVYLMAYMFMDVKQQEEQFDKQFRKPSMHVFFNLDEKKTV